MPERFRSLLCLLLTAFIWGNGFVAQSAAMGAIGPWTFTFLRSLLAGLVLIPVSWAAGKKTGHVRLTASEKENLWKGGILAGIILTAGTMFQQFGIMYTTVAKAGFLTALYCVLVPIFGFFTGQKPTLRIFISALLAMAGLYLLCLQESLHLARGDMLEIICAVLFAFHILVVDRYVDRTDPIRMSCVQFFTCALLSGVGAFFLEDVQVSSLPAAAPYILYAGVVSMGGGYTLQIVGQKNADPTLAAIVLCLESVFAALAGFVLLHEALSLREVLGCVVMFAAIVLASLPAHQKA